MSEIIKPQLMASGRFYGKETVRLENIYASCILYGTEKIRPQLLLASCILPEQTETVMADTTRNKFYSVRVDAEICRDVFRLNEIPADTERSIVLVPPVTADVIRCLSAAEEVRVDTSRLLSAGESVSADTVRKVQSLLQKAVADMMRRTAASEQVKGDGRRILSKTESIVGDIARHVPHILRQYAKTGVQSVTIGLNERTLSDSFQFVTTEPMAIEDAVKGILFDYPYHFLVEETSQRGILWTIKGMYSVDKMLYTALNIGVTSAMASYYLRQIAISLGLTVQISFEDFQPSQDYSQSGMTYQDFISSLFSWTSRLPQRQINVFLRGDTLYAVQRGFESSVLDITDWPHTMPVIDRKLVRSVWNSANDDALNNKAHDDKELDPIPFTGTIGIGDISREFVDGLLVRENNNGDVTMYSYSDEYITEKRTHNKDGSTVLTEYQYARTVNDLYLFAERERTTEPANDGKPHDEYDWKDWDGKGTERITYHSPLGYGWYAATVYMDGEYQGSSLSQGKPGGKASKFTIDESNLSLGSHYFTDEKEGDTIAGTSLIDTEFPVTGDGFLAELTKAINWLNRKRQEEVSLEIVSKVSNGVPEIQHIIDFTERIRFSGSEYFLVSNQVDYTPRSLRQKLKLVRWYE